MAVLLAAALLPPAAASGAPSDRAVLQRYAADTWRSMDAMVDPATGLPADNITGDLAPAGRSAYTSPTNIGAYLWSTVVARELGLVSRADADRRVGQTLATLGRLPRHPASGMYYNWYDPHTGAVLHTFPDDGSAITPFLSSVDNGWLAAALLVVQGAMPAQRAAAAALLRPMDFGFYYNPDVRLLRGGFYDTAPPGCSVVGNYRGRGPDVWYTCNHYDITVTEPRIASYLGIAFGQIPPEHYFATRRTFPPTCDWSWVEQQPTGTTRTYLGVDVYEGAYTYRGIRFVPSWGGDMFEALMPDLFVPEARWGPRSWGRNHPATVAGQIEHGLRDARYGYWGFSPASDPFGGYKAWGVDAMGMDPAGYPSDVEGANYDAGFGDCRPAGPAPTYGDGVVTPHAVFLALPYARQAALDNLARMEAHLGAYGPGGFYDAVAVRSGTVAKRYLALDQGMIMGALGNELRGDLVKRSFVTPAFERAVRPLLAMEEFGV
ncbi:glucoamylase family protein [Dactylosporangium sp. AC04546]|uniref:glucoamylase family protein n=1 Tax=Dactylosporangium sp. AC04546 TaxID=2862460 RepID=UPI002E7AE879|nr:glucoamylase family protein [Dactylosporangium sp. AC04546]WVK87373.1 glucoamylase family protein [Dactylosporangium sp. AC04546]